MALTAEGAALTDAHRREQVGLGASSQIVARALWPDLDPSRLDASTPAWLASNVNAAALYYGESAKTATQYLEQYRLAERGSSAGPMVVPPFDRRQAARELLLAGPVQIKLLVRGGLAGDAAHSRALTRFSGVLGRASMMGGRKVVDETAQNDTNAIGWRRVSDGDPCTFCSMLCARGPVYRSAEKATARAGDPLAGSGLEYHTHCGCTAEIVYGEWKPTEREQHYIDLYEAAAQEATEVDGVRTRDTVLWRMRRDGDLRDSAARRRITP